MRVGIVTAIGIKLSFAQINNLLNILVFFMFNNKNMKKHIEDP
ncbi:hypothetical protein GCM10007870_22590 [Gluconobacter kondonii]|uniref:Transposase n=1 Tax=Gluconobacter kondonii TaxID=941463 RepID=A0ABQ5WVM4_9PROT|nr:hypothetical protein GCM10007870_22590 [Gluconobacter kondonii]